MTRRHPVEFALDLARMPALARSSAVPPIPPNVIELMRVAAASPTACQEAAAATGEPVDTLIEAARFYLQLLLFRPDADRYRILGIEPGTPRATARSHMHCLLQWLHPDRNSGLEAVYAERVLKAWRQVSNEKDMTAHTEAVGAGTNRTSERKSGSFRLPWIKFPAKPPRLPFNFIFLGPRITPVVAIVAVVMLIFLALSSAAYFFGPDQTAAMVLRP